ncbi:MAG: hypothetical protein R3310_03020 [Candidatus Competibacteraceae bacterium]|nr:hypothetical protein [Candidatus Competibacteraceae bacterium]
MTRLLALGLLWLALTLTAWADDRDGRYQAVVIPPAAGSSGEGAEVLILDTREGHFWSWSANQLLRDSQGRPRIGNTLVYRGQVQPGQRPGEVILAPREP